MKKRKHYTKKEMLIGQALCMLVFLAFTATVVFEGMGFCSYGTEILSASDKEDYYESARYQRDVLSEVQDLLSTIERIQAPENTDVFTITDVETGCVHYYSKEAFLEAYPSKQIETLYDLQPYEIKKEQIAEHMFYSYYTGEPLRYLQDKGATDNYFFFGKDEFKRLFLKYGRSNAEHRYLPELSSDSYVFSVQEETVRQKGYESLEGDSYVFSVQEETDDSEKTVKKYYAAYDSDQNVYYSTRDDYFPAYDSYIYKESDIRKLLSGTYAPVSVDVFVIGLLECKNYSFSGLAQSVYNDHASCESAKEEMQTRWGENSLVFFLKNSEFQRKNVNKASSIEALEHTYTITAEGKEEDSGRQLLYYSELRNALYNNFPADTTFSFGIDTSRDAGIYDFLQGSRNYAEYVRYIKAALVLTVLFGVTLILQAGMLLWHAGESGKQEGYGTVFYDRIPTLLWLLLSLAILYGTGVCVGKAVHYVWRNLNANENVPDIGLVVSGAVIRVLPFGLAVMEIAMSFVRRLRARNFRTHSLTACLMRKLKEAPADSRNIVIRAGRKLLAWWEKEQESFRGRDRTVFLLCIYFIANILCICMARINRNPVPFWLVIQVAAVAGVAGYLRNIHKLNEGISRIVKGDLDAKVQMRDPLHLLDEMADGVNHIGDGLRVAVETSLKDERMKTELITNVSHDLKTPLTSIINYIELLKQEEMPTEASKHYVEVLDGKAHRLKQLTEDLVEAAKATSGNLELEMMPLALDELMKQVLAEFEEKFQSRRLAVVTEYPRESMVILADGRRMYRIMDNIFQNAYKYALEGTRLYLDFDRTETSVKVTLKNISAMPLNISTEELMERFTRGDAARSTEGSGLGLSIARDLCRLQGGTFDIFVDGDLFKAVITFPLYADR